MQSDLVYKMAFSFLKGINAPLLREIYERKVDAEEFFRISSRELMQKLRITDNPIIEKLRREEALSASYKELEIVRRHNIMPLFLLDDNYPERLAEIEDAPIILYCLGNPNIENEHNISVVGTRRPTPYAIDFTNKLIKDLSEYFPDLCVISGLAYGVDAQSHKKALENKVKTVAVVAHGLNMIYPASHRDLARNIIRAGGAIVSEYPFGVNPYKPHFLARNRIVAALSDVTVVVESAIKGGAISTANFAFSYSREVMALPGRITDENSSGCNLLIRKQKASLISNAADLIETTGWQPLNLNINPRQRNLFPELEGDFKIIYELLKFSNEPLQADKICNLANLSASTVLSVLGELEFDGIVIRHPGNRFSIA